MTWSFAAIDLCTAFLHVWQFCGMRTWLKFWGLIVVMLLMYNYNVTYVCNCNNCILWQVYCIGWINIQVTGGLIPWGRMLFCSILINSLWVYRNLSPMWYVLRWWHNRTVVLGYIWSDAKTITLISNSYLTCIFKQLKLDCLLDGMLQFLQLF